MATCINIPITIISTNHLVPSIFLIIFAELFLVLYHPKWMIGTVFSLCGYCEESFQLWA